MRGPTQAHLAACGVDAEVLSEPAQRNTGPALAYAAARLGADEDDPIAFLPADHYIPDTSVFSDALESAAWLAAEKNVLVVMGKPPERPETGYGYVECGGIFYGASFFVKRFVEKPNVETAIQYLQSGAYWWNTGIVVAKPSIILEELQRHAPEIAAAVTASVGSPASYFDAPNLSFDYAVLEKSERVVMLEARFRWSDVGSWVGWGDLAPTDKDHNARSSAATVISDNAKSNIVWSNRTVALQDVSNLVIIDDDKTLLITTREAAQRIKDIRNQTGAIDPALL